MENQIAELKNEIEYLRDQLAAHQFVLALLLRPAIAGSSKDDLQSLINKFSCSVVPKPDQTKLLGHLEKLLEIVEYQDSTENEKSPE